MKLNNERCIIKMLGAIIGDICGSIYEFNPVNSKDEITDEQAADIYEKIIILLQEHEDEE